MRLRYWLIIIAAVLIACGEETGIRKVTQVHPNGNAKSVVIYNMDETERLYHFVYYEDRKLKSEGAYVQDKKNGQWKSYYHSGALWTVNTYAMDILEGDYIMYNDTHRFQETPQTIRLKGQYTNGQQSGVWHFYDDLGEFVERKDYGSPTPE